MQVFRFGRLTAVMAIAIAFSYADFSWGQVTYTVNQSGTGDYTNIQDAIDASTHGDTVEVTDAQVYTELVDFDGKNITLVCDTVNRATIQPPLGTVTVLIDMTGGLTRQATLMGFRIRNATLGAINCSNSSPSIVDNVIASNTLPAGNFNSAGVTAIKSSPLIRKNVFSSNEVFENGAAIYLEGQSIVAGTPVTEISDNYFSRNTAVDLDLTPFDRKGGAIYAVGDSSGAEIDPILIQRNEFDQNWARGYGGAIAMESRPATILENTFNSNQMRFGDSDFYPCGSPVSYGGGAISLVNCDYGVCILDSNTYLGNESDYDGGSIYVWNSNAIVSNEVVERSKASCRGGGAFSGAGSATIISDSEFTLGRANRGGGVAFSDDNLSILTRSTVRRNGSGLAGAGIFSENSKPVLSDLLVDGNGEDVIGGGFAFPPMNGGGIAIDGGTATIERCEIIRNAAVGDGGGIHAEGVGTDLTVLNCILGANKCLDDPDLMTISFGAAMYVEFAAAGDATPFVNNTVARNRAESTGFAGVYVATPNDMDVINCIVWNNKNGYDPFAGTTSGSNQTVFNSVLGSTGFFVDYSDIKNTSTFTAGPKNIAEIPKFVDIPNADFRIKSNSPCVNVGDNSAPLISSGDIDNQARIVDGFIEMGADEVLAPKVSGPVSGG